VNDLFMRGWPTVYLPTLQFRVALVATRKGLRELRVGSRNVRQQKRGMMCIPSFAHALRIG